MTGTCCGSMCEEGKTLHPALLWPGERERESERREMDRKKKERRETFTEPEPEKQSEKEYNLFFPLRSVCSLSAQSS